MGTSVHLCTPIIAKAKPGIIAQIDGHTVNLRLERRNDAPENGGHSVDENGRDARVHEKLFLRSRAFGISKSCALVSVSHGGVDTGKELFVQVDADRGCV